MFVLEVVLKLLKLFLRARSFGDLEHVESNCFAQWSAFTNGDDVADLDITSAKQSRAQRGSELRKPTENRDSNERKDFCDVFRNDCIYEYNVNNLDG